MQEPALTPAVDMTSRDRHMRLRMNATTPAERLAAMRRLLAQSWAMLQRNPAGLAHFRSRNFKARSISNSVGRVPHGT